MKKVAYIVDMNWYIHRVFFTTKYLAANPAQNMCYRLLSMICKDAIACKANHILLAIDGEHVFRHDIYPSYKANRGGKAVSGPAGHEPYEHLASISKFFKRLSFPVVQLEKYEADDVLCSVATQFDGHVVVGTADKDSYQYLSDHVCMYNSAAKPNPEFIREEDVVDKIGLPASLALDYQTVIGDPIDNVPRLYSIAKTKKALLEHGSFKKWWAADKELRLAVAPAALKLNRKLVKLVGTIDCEMPASPKKLAGIDNRSYSDWFEFMNPKTKSLF
jgi:DNA polymerase-1